MYIRTTFRDDYDLVRRFDRDFVCMVHKLEQKYISMGKQISAHLWRATTFAFLYYSAAVDGNATLMRDFDNILRGEGQDYLIVNDRPFRLEDENVITLTWDIAALMLETNKQLPPVSYDIVDRHVLWAYIVQTPVGVEVEIEKTTVIDQVKGTAISLEKVSVERQDTTTNIPLDVMNYFLKEAEATGNAEYMDFLKASYTKYIMQKFHPKEYELLNSYGIKPSHETPALSAVKETPISYNIKEYVAVKHVDTQISNIEKEGIGINKV